MSVDSHSRHSTRNYWTTACIFVVFLKSEACIVWSMVYMWWTPLVWLCAKPMKPLSYSWKTFEVGWIMSMSSDSISHKGDTFSGIMLVSRSTKSGPISCVIYGVFGWNVIYLAHTKLMISFSYPHITHLEWLESSPFIHIQGIPLETIGQ